jgi:hypothetical protein
MILLDAVNLPVIFLDRKSGGQRGEREGRGGPSGEKMSGRNGRDSREVFNAAVAHAVKPRAKRTKAPSIETMEEWMMEGIGEALDGCTVEPDGTCEHGSPSWMVELGMI